MGMYEGYDYGGMHLIWWVLWMIVLFWIFATPYRIPGQRSRKYTPLDLLKTRFVNGEIDEVEYREKKELIES